MYKIIGADQVEYGPVSAEQISQWIAEGRMNGLSQVQAEGTTEWKAAKDFPEFAEALGQRQPHLPGSSAPPMPIETTGAEVGKMSSMAVWSLVLGILGFATFGLALLITAPLGLVLGLVALSKIRKSQGTLRGHGVALAGTIVSGVSIVLLPVLAILAGMLLPALAKAKGKAQEIQCMNNMKQLSLAARMYATDNKDHFPAAANWCDVLMPTVGGSDQVFHCPAAPQPGGNGTYAYNVKLAGADSAKLSPNTVLFFEAGGGWNLSGGQELLPARPHHRNAYIVAFVDGHVERVDRSRMHDLNWEP